jgi:hypothetical protein
MIYSITFSRNNPTKTVKKSTNPFNLTNFSIVSMRDSLFLHTQFRQISLQSNSLN